MSEKKREESDEQVLAENQDRVIKKELFFQPGRVLGTPRAIQGGGKQPLSNEYATKCMLTLPGQCCRCEEELELPKG